MRLPRLPALAAAVLCAGAATGVGTDGVGAAAVGEKPPPPPHILTIIVDDMGFADTMIHNPTSFMTPTFGRLARTGITLLRHHTYLCARRSRPSPQLPTTFHPAVRRVLADAALLPHGTISRAPHGFAAPCVLELHAAAVLDDPAEAQAGRLRPCPQPPPPTSPPPSPRGPTESCPHPAAVSGDALRRQGPPRPAHRRPPADPPWLRTRITSVLLVGRSRTLFLIRRCR